MFPTCRAFIRAQAFDVSSDIGVLWTVRTDGPSLTQRQGAGGNTIARLVELTKCLDLIQQEQPDFIPFFLRKILEHDLGIMARNSKFKKVEAKRQIASFFDRILANIK